MKVQLEKIRTFKILKVQEEIGPNDVDILRVGVTRLCGMNRAAIILDLKDAVPKPETLPGIAKLEVLAFELEVPLVIAGAALHLCHVPDVDAAVKLLDNPKNLAKQQQKAALLAVKSLMEKRLSMEYRIAAIDEGTLSLRELRRRNLELKAIAEGMETRIGSLTSFFKAEVKSPQAESQLKLLRKKLFDIGILG